jgi:hypothetical protein
MPDTPNNITPYPVDENGIRIRLGRDPGLRMEFNGDGGGGEGDGGEGGNTGGGNTDPNANDDKLGENGLKALESERRARAQADKARTATEKERDDALARLKEFEEKSKSDSEKERDKAVREAEERVRKEIAGTANARLVKASVRVAAAGKLADPEDAVRFLNLDDFTVDDDGEVDDKAIASAIDGLLKEKPYLGGKPGKPKGNVDQGARDGGDRKVAPGMGRLQQAYADSGTKNT